MSEQLCMDVDTALAEVPVNVMPLIDDTDFKSIEAAVVYNAAGMALKWHFVTTAGAMTETAVTPTTAGDYDWTDQGTSGLYAIEIPASGGASANNDTEGFGWFTGVATGVLPWRGPVICFRAAALNNALIDGGGNLSVSLVATGLDAVLKTATGMVAIASAVWDRVLTGGTHNISNSAGRRLRLLAESGNIYNGLVHLDTVDGTAGTTVGEHGTPDNPTDLLASAKTIAGNIGGGIKDFHLINGSSIELAEDTTDESYFGDNWTLALGGENITGAFIQGAAISGIATATSGYHLSGCELGAVTLDNDGHFERCGLTGTFTAGQAGTFTFHNCFTESASGVVMDFGALGATTINLFGFDGDIIPTNMAAGDLLHITGAGSIVTATCTGGTIDRDGQFQYTDAGGNVTEGKSDIESDVSSILDDTGTDGVLLAAAQGPIVFTGVSNEAGITLIGHGTGAGFEMTGGATGEGLLATGGATSGAGLKSIAGGGGSGVHFAGIGANAGLRADGGATGDGIHAHGGATSGAGMVVHAHANNDDALVLTPHGTGDAEANISAILARTMTAANLVKIEASVGTNVIGAAEAGTLSTTQMTSDLTEATDDHYIGRTVIWTSGVLINQASDITDYAGATGLLTYTDVTEAPSAADTFVIV